MKILSLEEVPKGILVRALEGPRFEEVRNYLCALPYRQAVYEAGEFKAWSLPNSSIDSIFQKFSLQEVELNFPPAGIVETYLNSRIPIKECLRDYELYSPLDGRTLFSYQRDYARIDFSKKSLLCSFAQGCGKTLTSLVRAKSIGYKKLLIICPKRLLINWRSEIFQCFGENALIYTGTKKKRDALKTLIPEYSNIIVNYEMVKELEFQPDHVIFDEIHNLCNLKTEIHKEAFRISQKAEYRQGLSGTPMRLNPRDLWGVLRLLDPVFAGSRKAFLDEYEAQLAFHTVYKNFKKIKVPVSFGLKNEDKLRKKLDAIMYRITREGIVDFKESIDIVHCELLPQQKKLYREISSNIIKDMESGELRGLKNTLERILRLLQASEGAFNLGAGEDSGKLEYVKEMLKDRQEKLIVWSKFKPMTWKLYNLFKDRSVIYNGDVTDNLKNLGVWAFQGCDTEQDLEDFYRLRKYYPDFKFEPGEAQFFFGTIHLKSALGINLHRNCNECLFTSYDYNPNANAQATDRIARIGQTEDVKTTFLVSEGTIEYRMLKKVLDNYQTSLRILDGEANLTYNQVKDLISSLREHIV